MTYLCKLWKLLKIYEEQGTCNHLRRDRAGKLQPEKHADYSSEGKLLRNHGGHPQRPHLDNRLFGCHQRCADRRDSPAGQRNDH